VAVPRPLRSTRSRAISPTLTIVALVLTPESRFDSHTRCRRPWSRHSETTSTSSSADRDQPVCYGRTAQGFWCFLYVRQTVSERRNLWCRPIQRSRLNPRRIIVSRPQSCLYHTPWRESRGSRHTLYGSRSPVHYSSHLAVRPPYPPGHLVYPNRGYSDGPTTSAAPTEPYIRCNYSRPAVMRCFVPTGTDDWPDYTTNRGWSPAILSSRRELSISIALALMGSAAVGRRWSR